MGVCLIMGKQLIFNLIDEGLFMKGSRLIGEFLIQMCKDFQVLIETGKIPPKNDESGRPDYYEKDFTLKDGLGRYRLRFDGGVLSIACAGSASSPSPNGYILYNPSSGQLELMGSAGQDLGDVDIEAWTYEHSYDGGSATITYNYRWVDSAKIHALCDVIVDEVGIPDQKDLGEPLSREERLSKIYTEIVRLRDTGVISPVYEGGVVVSPTLYVDNKAYNIQLMTDGSLTCRPVSTTEKVFSLDVRGQLLNPESIAWSNAELIQLEREVGKIKEKLAEEQRRSVSPPGVSFSSGGGGVPTEFGNGPFGAENAGGDGDSYSQAAFPSPKNLKGIVFFFTTLAVSLAAWLPALLLSTTPSPLALALGGTLSLVASVIGGNVARRDNTAYSSLRAALGMFLVAAVVTGIAFPLAPYVSTLALFVITGAFDVVGAGAVMYFVGKSGGSPSSYTQLPSIDAVGANSNFGDSGTEHIPDYTPSLGRAEDLGSSGRPRPPVD